MNSLGAITEGLICARLIIRELEDVRERDPDHRLAIDEALRSAYILSGWLEQLLEQLKEGEGEG